MGDESCDITNENSCGCSNEPEKVNKTLIDHWDKAYINGVQEKLGWFETDLAPSINLIEKTELPKNATVLNVGAGSTTLIDELLNLGYTNLIATDLSKVALNNLENRIGSKNVEFIVDDLINPIALKAIPKVDLWIDRAVLHFFTEKKDQDTYFELLNNTVKNNGFVLIAEFNLEGAKKCSGLDVFRYSKEMLVEKLQKNFQLIESFNYTYIQPSGGERPYIYTLFQKK